MKILVCGAGVAGLATTIYLQRAGHDVTLIERANELRMVGGPVDVRGDALEFSRELGLLDAMRAAEVHMTDDAYFIDNEGNAVADFFYTKDSPDDLEIERISLMPILDGALSEDTDLRYGTMIESFEDLGDHVHVVLTDGSEDDYDLLVGADGVHSSTRRMAWGQPESAFADFLGVYVGFAPIGPTQPVPTQIFNMPGAKMICLAESLDREYTTFYFRSEQLDYDYHDQDAIRQILLDRYPEDLWRTRELLGRAVASDGLWFDECTQIKMDTWRKGRVVLVGDSAHCATPLAGRGTTLGITGGRALTLGLGEFPDDLDAALARYEELQRPYVNAAQPTVGEGIALMMPNTQAEIEERNAMVRRMIAESKSA